MSCNCLIGWIGDEFIHKADIKEILDEMIRSNKMMNQYYHYHQITEIKDYFDQRKAVMYRFKYCPECGEKINWKEIKNNCI